MCQIKEKGVSTLKTELSRLEAEDMAFLGAWHPISATLQKGTACHFCLNKYLFIKVQGALEGMVQIHGVGDAQPHMAPSILRRLKHHAILSQNHLSHTQQSVITALRGFRTWE